MRKNFFSILFILFSVGTGFSQVQMPVYYATSSQNPEPGQDISNALDGNVNTDYHTKWYENGIPDTLTFYFSSIVQNVNQLEYTPRLEGYNGIWSKISLFYSSGSTSGQFIPVTDSSIIWQVDNEVKEFSFHTAITDIKAIRIIVEEGYDNFSSCAELKFFGTLPLLPDGSDDCSLNGLEGPVNRDIKLTIDPNGSSASSFQPFENIENSFDGNYNTLYHSNYDANPDNFPIELIYHFSNHPTIDYFVYYPRPDWNPNGKFGNVKIYYNTASNPDYIYLKDFDFKMINLPTEVAIPATTEVNNIKIVVENGANNFASCAEMEFYTKADSSDQSPYDDIFGDELYTTLKAGVQQAQIDTIASPFFKALAQCIYNSSFDTENRVRTYHAYESIDHLRQRLKVSSYDQYENPTGIVFDKDLHAIVAAKGIGEQQVYLKVHNWANEPSQADHIYLLRDGINSIMMKDTGLAYISFYVDTPETAQPITLNIINGRINGYFNPDTDNAGDWVKLMTNQAYPKLDILGKYVHLVYDKLALRNNSPFDGHHLIEVYDTIVNWQKIQMGLYKYNYEYNNHILAICETGGGYYAGGEGAHFDLTWGPEAITNPNKLGLWGIAHEFGHVNQIRPGLNWIGTTEVTNNIYSLWADYHQNKENKLYTRLEEERFTNGDATQNWSINRFNICLDSTYVNGKALQDVSNDYPFKVLVPFWQLELYYQLAGACRNAPILTYETNPPVQGIDYAHWYGYVAQQARTLSTYDMTNGEHLINFVKFTCEAVQEDLSDFFIKTGFLRPIDKDIDDYGIGRLTITQDQIDQLIQYIKSHFPNKPVSPVIHYISALTKDIYLYRRELSGETGEGVTLVTDEVSPYLLIDHSVWQNPVAFETYDSTGTLKHVTLSGTGDITHKTTSVLYREGDYQVYAVGFDGKKILVYPKEIVNSNKNNALQHFTVFPNPVNSIHNIHLEVKNEQGMYRCDIYNNLGKNVFQSNGNLKSINKAINGINELSPGTYFITLRQGKNVLNSRFIIN